MRTATGRADRVLFAMRETQTDDGPQVDLLLGNSKIVREGEHALSLRAQEERGSRWADEQGYQVRKVWDEERLWSVSTR